MCEKDYVWNPATFNCKNRKYLASITDDSAVTCDEIIESHNEYVEVKSYDKQILTKRKQPVKRKIFIFYLHFY